MATTRSWKAMVLDADPEFFEPPVVYSFAKGAHSDPGGRTFYEYALYSHDYLMDASGRHILTADGKRIVIRDP